MLPEFAKYMPLTFLADRRLYTDFVYYQSQFNWDVSGERSQLIIYHCYWSGILSDLHELSLKSLLVTQSPPFEVWIWMPPDDIPRNRAFIAKFQQAPGIKFKSYIPREEAKGTPFEGHSDLLKGKVASKPRKWGRLIRLANALQARSSREHRNRANWRRLSDIANAFRILVLGKYGGVYFDLDILFLKDLRPLCSVEFFYQWSDQQYGNNAVLHFFKWSHNIRLLAERSVEIKSGRSPALLKFEELLGLLEGVYVFPSFLFDPVWIAHDKGMRLNDYCNKFGEFFTNEAPMTLAEFFPGAYAYHWHNHWHVAINPHTIIGNLNAEIQKTFEVNFQPGNQLQV